MPAQEPENGSNSLQFDYDQVAPVYDRHRRGRGPYFQALCALASKAPRDWALELGAGTGNNTEAMEAEFPQLQLVALDHSVAMLQEAQNKLQRPRCVHGDACILPFASARFYLIYSTYMIHHVRDIQRLFQEGLRVLQPDGYMATVSAPESFIDAHPMNQYFPSFAKIDRARFQPVEQVCDAMRSAGFSKVTHEIVADTPVPIDARYAQRVEQRFISTYHLIPPQEFEKGLQRLKADIACLGALPEPLVRKAVVIVGQKLP